MQYARSILELAFYHRDLRTCADERVLLEHQRSDAQKRTDGEHLVQACPGDWRKREIIHWCHGCCSSFEDAVDHVQSMLDAVCFRMLKVPSSNKWLSMWPLVADLCLMAAFHKVFKVAFQDAVGIVTSQNEDDLSDFSETELLGMPLEGDEWHKQEKRRALKAFRWIECRATFPKLMLFLHTVGPVMKLHYTLFKYAQLAPQGSQKSLLFQLCDLRVSVTAKILGELTELLFDGAPWDILTSLLGPLRGWPFDFKATARAVVLRLLGQVWRRLVYPFMNWPMRLVPLADPDLPRIEKAPIATALFAASHKVLDSGVSQKIRHLAGTADALLEPEWQEFLFNAFNKVVLSTAFIECLFAHFKQWVGRSPKPISTALLDAKHVTASFKRACAAKRANLDPALAQPAKRRKGPAGRPSWVMKRGELSGCTARHVVIGTEIANRPVGMSQTDAFRQACGTWRQSSPMAKAAAKRVALQRNARGKLLKQSSLASLNTLIKDAPSPWDVADGDPDFPLSPNAVQTILDQKDGVKSLARQWQRSGARCVEDPDFPEQVQYPHVIPAEVAGLHNDDLARVDELLEMFGVLFGRFAGIDFVPMLLSDTAGTFAAVFQCCSCLKVSPFKGEFVVYSRDMPSVDLTFPTVARLFRCPLPNLGVASTPTPLSLLTETQFAVEVIQARQGLNPWLFRRAIVDESRGEMLNEIHITGLEEPIDLVVLRASNAANALARRALRLHRAAQQPLTTQSRRAKGRRTARPQGRLARCVP